MMNITTKLALAELDEDDLRTMFMQRFPMVKPDELELIGKVELIEALLQADKMIVNY